MLFCTNCGAEVEVTEKFCPNCGRTQVKTKPKLQGKVDNSKKKSIPLIVALILFVAIGGITSVFFLFNESLFFSQVTDALKPESEDKITRGNSVGNIINGGIAAKQGDWIYYSNNNDDFKIYKVRLDGTERSKVNNDSSFQINVVDDWIYYSNFDDDYCIYKIRTDGTERTKINNELSSDINVVGEWIFYSSHSHDLNIFKIRTDGSGRTKLNNESAWNINVIDGWIYYVNGYQGWELKKLNIQNLEVVKLLDNVYYINVVDDWIYFTDSNLSKYGHGGRLYKIRIDGSGKELLDSGFSTHLNVVGDWIYYSNSNLQYKDNIGKIYKLSTDGKTRVQIVEVHAMEINVVGDWIYYLDMETLGADLEGYLTMYKIRIDGSDRQKVY